MLSRFFIDRPIFAWVVAIVIMLAGLLSIRTLPVEQYPDIALPQVRINASYPGASAKTVEDSVTQIIEQGMTGLDRLKYITASSSDSGSANVTLVFEAGTNIDTAQVQVQNQVQAVINRLPQDVQAQGVRVNKASNNQLLVISLYSTDGSLTNADLGDYLVSNVQDTLARVDGVGESNVFGSGYAMRIWLNPEKLVAFNLTPADVVTAIRAQNAQVSAGQLAAQPTTDDIALNATITSQSRLTTADEFRNIIVKSDTSGATVYLRDVARVELGQQSYDSISRLNGQPATGISISLATGANALKTAELVKAKMEELSKSFPKNIAYAIPNDSTDFIKLSIKEVLKTLIEAIVLVFIVMYLFLQNWRATIIPTIAVPVVLLGTLGILAAFGYSINLLTMFGLVLAIGLLVDDAIVVVENVERVMREEGLDPKEATRKSMDEITGALIGIGLVLSAMFVPMAFFGGTQGIIYRQFSITIVSAMALSVLVALILTPPLCATILKPVDPQKHAEKKGFFGWFNTSFTRASHGYMGAVGRIIGKPLRYLAIYGVVLVACGMMFRVLPTSFLPDEDQGFMQTIVQLPVGTTRKTTDEVVAKVEAYLQKDPTARYVFARVGSNGQNQGQVNIRMKPFEERKGSDLRVPAVIERARKEFAKPEYRNARIIPTQPPVVRSLGDASGFSFVIKDVGGVGPAALLAARNDFIRRAEKDPRLGSVRSGGQDYTPQLKIDINKTVAGAMGVSVSDINAMLAAAWGGSYVNDFIDRGRVKRVYVQADTPYRMRPEDLNRWYVRNKDGGMVPFPAFGSTRWQAGAPTLERYNGSPSTGVQGAPADGVSSGDAMAAIEDLATGLPQGTAIEWTGLSLQERESGAQAPALYALSVLVVFLLLAALYESWTIPFSVILVLPLAVLGALVATWARGLDNDIFFQVGLLTTIGLSCKNAILIVEYARTLQERGMGLIDATLEASRIRLRPILMTSFAFTFGVLPLALANGAGSGAQHAIGTGLIGGVLSATLLAIFYIPLFFVLVQKLFNRKYRNEAKEV
ncbi:efflux RND transporter permease subunit [Asticcacaulis excentricus]|uniref:Efflux pump membrane transporter n=1 Tax=Asticcacaulis excentricus TaxID=78587 RepID=A0A3G9G4S7_9CAUL|nr:efflux RND transporter permease subunit [Asticcacaulis excentricus]BBF81767.1 RND efflux system, inner membrane transporter CmeB [Asticcacaulis excentricus]